MFSGTNQCFDFSTGTDILFMFELQISIEEGSSKYFKRHINVLWSGKII